MRYAYTVGILSLTLVSTFAFFFGLSKEWTLYYAVCAPAVFFCCLWIIGAKTASVTAKLVSVCVVVGLVSPFMYRVSLGS